MNIEPNAPKDYDLTMRDIYPKDMIVCKLPRNKLNDVYITNPMPNQDYEFLEFVYYNGPGLYLGYAGKKNQELSLERKVQLEETISDITGARVVRDPNGHFAKIGNDDFRITYEQIANFCGRIPLHDWKSPKITVGWIMLLPEEIDTTSLSEEKIYLQGAIQGEGPHFLYKIKGDKIIEFDAEDHLNFHKSRD